MVHQHALSSKSCKYYLAKRSYVESHLKLLILIYIYLQYMYNWMFITNLWNELSAMHMTRFRWSCRLAINECLIKSEELDIILIFLSFNSKVLWGFPLLTVHIIFSTEFCCPNSCPSLVPLTNFIFVGGSIKAWKVTYYSGVKHVWAKQQYESFEKNLI